MKVTIVIIDNKNNIQKQALYEDCVKGTKYSVKVIPTLESFLGGNPNDVVVKLEDIVEPEAFRLAAQQEAPEWICFNSHFWGDTEQQYCADFIIHEQYDLSTGPFPNMPALCRKNDPTTRYVIIQALDGDHLKLLKETIEIDIVLRSAELNSLQATILSDGFNEFIDGWRPGQGLMNVIPMQWLDGYADGNNDTIIDMCATDLSSLKLEYINYKTYLFYQALNETVVCNFRKLLELLPNEEKVHIYYAGKTPSIEMHLTEPFVNLLEKVSLCCNDIVLSLVNTSNEGGYIHRNICLNGNVARVETPENREIVSDGWKVEMAIYPKNDEDNIDIDKQQIFDAVKSWAENEFLIVQNRHRQLRNAVTIQLQETDKKVTHLLDKMIADMESDSDFAKNMKSSLEYIKRKFSFIATFMHPYSSSRDLPLSDICDELLKYQYIFQAMSSPKKITIRVDIEDGLTEKSTVYLPHLGDFAIFNIMEAVIRNTIKHEENIGDKKELVFVLKFGLDKNKDYVTCSFYREDLEANNKNANTNETVRAIKEYLNAPIITDDNSFINKWLGIKEIRACIAYLRREHQIQEGDGLMEIDVEQAVWKMGNGQWGYRALLHRYHRYVYNGSNSSIRECQNTYNNICAWNTIMSRNLAHNLGSHALNTLIEEASYEARKQERGVDPTIRRLLSTLCYIRDKMDFLASFAYVDASYTHMHAEALSVLSAELKSYREVFQIYAAQDIDINVRLNGEPVSNTNDILIALPDSGKHAICDILETFIMSHQSNINNRGEINIDCEKDNDWINVSLVIPDAASQYIASYLIGELPEKQSRLRLQEAKEILFITDNDDDFKTLTVKGLSTKKRIQLEQCLSDGQVINQDFLVLVGENAKYFERSNLLPLRQVKMSMSEIGANDEESLVNLCWERCANDALNRVTGNWNKKNSTLVIGEKKAYANNHGSIPEESDDNYYYYEAASSYVQKTSPLFLSRDLIKISEIRKNPTPQFLLYNHQIIEYTTLPIIILDERLQELYGNIIPNWKWMQTFLPNVEEWDLRANESFESKLGSFMETVTNWRSSKGINMRDLQLVIHESLLCQLFEDDYTKMYEYMDKLVKDHPDWVIYFVTGRGKSQRIGNSSHIRFIPFTSLSNAFTELNKFKLYQLLMSGRKY